LRLFMLTTNAKLLMMVRT